MLYKSKVFFSVIVIFIGTLLLANFAYPQSGDSNLNTIDDNSEEEKSFLDEDAENENEPNTDEFLSGESGNSNFFPMMMLLVLLIGAIYLIIRWIAKKKNISFVGSEFAKVEGTKALALNKYLQLVVIGNRYYILGVAENSVNLIKELTDKEQINLIKLDLSKSKPLKPFVEQFKSFIKNISGNKSQNNKEFQSKLENQRSNSSYYKYEEDIEDSIDQQTGFEEVDKEKDDEKISDESDYDFYNSFDKFSYKEHSTDKNKISTKINRKKYQKNLKITEENDNYKNNDMSVDVDKTLEYTGDKSIEGKVNNDIDQKDDRSNVFDDSNFDFIKKQRERLANLGIKLDNNKDKK